MKILIKPIAVIVLGAYSFALGQDIYPYFLDPTKQFEFESKKIYINEVNKEKMIISGGGDTYQFFDSLIDGKTVYRQEPIRTSYNYIYKFEIKINGNLINEIEFLQIVGLNNHADKILKSYYGELSVYKKKLKDYNSKNNQYEGEMIFLAEKLEWLGIIGLATILAPLGVSDGDPEVSLGFMAVGVGITGVYLLTWLIPIGRETLTNPPPREPVLRQQLDNQQIMSISESYNRKIFEEIRTSN